MSIVSSDTTKHDACSYFSKVSPASMEMTMRTVNESAKVPMAQVLAVMTFCGALAKDLRLYLKAMPEFMRTDWKFT